MTPPTGSYSEKVGDDARQCLAIVYDKLGRHTDAEAELAKIKATDGDASAYAYAGIYAQWGDRANALEWLNTAMRTHDPLQRCCRLAVIQVSALATLTSCG